MYEDWRPVAALLLGVSFLVYGLFLRVGRMRRPLLFWYQNEYVPQSVRNVVFTYIPMGLGLVLVGAGMILNDAGDIWRDLGLLAFVIGLASLAVGLGIQLHPPRWAKPEWLRDEEHQGGDERRTSRT